MTKITIELDDTKSVPEAILQLIKQIARDNGMVEWNTLVKISSNPKRIKHDGEVIQNAKLSFRAFFEPSMRILYCRGWIGFDSDEVFGRNRYIGEDIRETKFLYSADDPQIEARNLWYKWKAAWDENENWEEVIKSVS